MSDEHRRMISVSDINSWLYCPRKLFLQRICGLSPGPNRNMAVGKLKHSILENFSKNEEKFISRIDKDYEKIDLAFMYEDFLKGVANSVFIENNALVEKFMIDKDDMLKKVARDFAEDIKIRIQSIKEKTSEGIFGRELGKNLDSVYISELRVESEELGLRGRVDRVSINRVTGEIIPFELKSREGRIFHSDEIQLVAYAMLIEEKYRKKIEKGIIEVGNMKQELVISEELKREVLALADEIRKIYAENPCVPMIQSNFNKCRSCEFQEECGKLK